MSCLKQRLQAGEVCFGPFMKFLDPTAVEIFGLAGFDHVIIDGEHGPISIESAQNMVRAAQLRNIAPLIRVSRNDEAEILRALDIGAEGVHIPQIRCAEDATHAVEACYYHPKGMRGMCRFVRAANYTDTPREQYFPQINEQTLPVLHIEGVAGIEALPEILQVDGIGVIFLGPYDLSQSCGVPGQVQHPVVVDKMRYAVRLAREVGAVVGTFVDNAEAAKLWIEVGVQYICYSVDVGILMDAAKTAAGALKGLVK